MSPVNKEPFELVAKHCPKCEHLVMAKISALSSSDEKYEGYKCSSCNWISPDYTIE